MNKTIIRHSERIYNFLLQFYPKQYRERFGGEMKYVFSESLNDAYIAQGEPGIINHWIRTGIDALKSLVVEHVENQKGGGTMKSKHTDIRMHNKAFLWVGVGTVLLLLIPFFAMQLNVMFPDPGDAPSTLNWSLFDFAIMGALISGVGSSFVMLARMTRNSTNRIVIAMLLLIAFFLMWAELAVGIFGTPFAGN